MWPKDGFQTFLIKFALQVGEDFVNCLNEYSENGKEIQSKEMMISYTLDAISKCGLGIESKAFSEPNGKFRQIVARATGNGKPNPLVMAKFLIILAAPWLGDLLGLSFIDEPAMDFFEEVINETLKQRKRDKIRRNDFIDLALDALKNAENDHKEVENDQFETPLDAFQKGLDHENYITDSINNIYWMRSGTSEFETQTR